MGSKQLYFCDICESEEDIEHIIFHVIPSMPRPVEMDVCREHRENFPLEKVLADEIADPLKADHFVKRGEGKRTTRNTTDATNPSARKEITCQACRQVIHGGQGYAKHWTTNHPELPFPGYGPYQCTECERKFPSPKSMSQHFNREHGLSLRDLTAEQRKALETPIEEELVNAR